MFCFLFFLKLERLMLLAFSESGDSETEPSGF